MHGALHDRALSFSFGISLTADTTGPHEREFGEAAWRCCLSLIPEQKEARECQCVKRDATGSSATELCRAWSWCTMHPIAKTSRARHRLSISSGGRGLNIRRQLFLSSGCEVASIVGKAASEAWALTASSSATVGRDATILHERLTTKLGKHANKWQQVPKRQQMFYKARPPHEKQLICSARFRRKHILHLGCKRTQLHRADSH